MTHKVPHVNVARECQFPHLLFDDRLKQSIEMFRLSHTPLLRFFIYKKNLLFKSLFLEKKIEWTATRQNFLLFH